MWIFFFFTCLIFFFTFFLTQAGYFPPIFEHTAFTRPHDLESIHPQEQIYLLRIPAKKKTKKDRTWLFPSGCCMLSVL